MPGSRHPLSEPLPESPVTRYDGVTLHHTLLTGFVLLWGGNFVLAEVALREMAPLSFSVARFAAGGLALMLLLYARSVAKARQTGEPLRFLPRIVPSDGLRLLIVALLGATLAPWLGIEGLARTHGGRAALWLALGPVVSTAIGYALRTERIGKMGAVGVILATFGTLVLAADGLRPERAFWLGDLLLVGALIAAVSELHLIKPLATRYGATAAVAARTVIGGLLYLLIATPALAREPWLNLSVWVWIAILAGGGAGVGVGQWVKVKALRTLGPTRIVLYGNLVPVAALGLAWAIIGTIPSRLEVLAAVFILIGAVLLQVFDAPNRIGHVPEEEALETLKTPTESV